MSNDLKIIKKKFGENMSRLCRDMFPTILETEGLLSNLMLKSFNPNHSLYDDIVDNDLEENFKKYIYNLIDVEKGNQIQIDKTPQALLDEAGYVLYECHTEDDIQQFKKYYAKGEELCTFKGNRLKKCHVFFAVKKDVDSIKREDFTNPTREDKYGTSVISIQFTRDDSHTLSIKNRYNHHVNNPDSTFSNNLENIIPGLTESFARTYGLYQTHGANTLEIPNYVKASDNKYYKYNYEINNIYYCPNNIIIDNFEVKQLEKEKYVLLDYFILDLQNKTISLYDEKEMDGFVDSVKDIEKIEIENTDDKKKKITIKEKDQNIVDIVLDEQNRILEYTNNGIEKIKRFFLKYNQVLEKIELQNAVQIGLCFLHQNYGLKEIELPSAKIIEMSFIERNKQLEKIEMPEVEKIESNFLKNNQSLKTLSLPNLKYINDFAMYYNRSLETLNTPKLEVKGYAVLGSNQKFNELDVNELVSQSKVPQDLESNTRVR